MSREDWKETTLGELITLEYGKGLTKKNRSGSGFPVYGSAGVVGFHKDYLVEGPAIIVGRKGTIGHVEWSVGNCFPIDTAFYVKVREDSVEVLDFEFCYFLLLALDLSRFNSQTGVPGLHRGTAYTAPVQLPPIEEQREIVSFMQALDLMIQAGDREISSAEQMRGDVLNALLDPAEQNWEEVVLGERISITRRNVKPENFGSETVPLYSIPGFDDGEFPQETKSNSVKSAKLEVDEDSILISLLNPRIPRVSQAVIPGYCSTEFAVVQPEEGVDFDFLYYLFSGTKFSDYLTKASRGTTGSRTRAKREDILEYLASVPPLEEQEKIVEKMQTLDAYLESAKRSQEALEQVRQDALHALLSGDKDVRELAEMFATDEDVA